MDLTRTVGYRNFALNTVKFDAQTRDMVGCEIESVEYTAVEGVGYDEKRALSDGTDTSDIYLHKRFISLRGNLYGRSRAEAFMAKRQLLDVLSPQDAYYYAKSQHGFFPLDFYEPTGVSASFPSGLIHQIMFARPSAIPSIRFASDSHGGFDDGALALPWTAQLECRDPRIYSWDWTVLPLSVAATSGSGNFLNKGNRTTPVHVLLLVPPLWNGATTAPRGSFRLRYEAVDLTIQPLNVNYWQAYEYNSHDKVLERRTAGNAVNELRMDLLTHGSGRTHGDLSQGQHSYTWTRSGTSKQLLAGSYVRFRDAWS